MMHRRMHFLSDGPYLVTLDIGSGVGKCFVFARERQKLRKPDRTEP
jgi:hypothetical protein